MNWPPHTSITTIPNANTSDFLLWVPAPFRISGAVNRGVPPPSPFVLTSEFESRATVARPKSTIRAHPAASTSMFAYTLRHQHGYCKSCDGTYCFEVPMDDVTRMKITEAIGNAQQLRAW